MSVKLLDYESDSVLLGCVPYVKSPVASGTLCCSSVRNRVRVTMLVLMVAVSAGGTSPFEAIVKVLV